jgi:hypothetical protein
MTNEGRGRTRGLGGAEATTPRTADPGGMRPPDAGSLTGTQDTLEIPFAYDP